jgi:hypothetical protein
MPKYTTSYSRIYRREYFTDENPNQDNRPVTQDLPIRTPEWEGSIQLPSRTCLGGSAVPTDLSVVENGIWDSSLFVFHYSAWCCGEQHIVLLELCVGLGKTRVCSCPGWWRDAVNCLAEWSTKCVCGGAENQTRCKVVRSP